MPTTGHGANDFRWRFFGLVAAAIAGAFLAGCGGSDAADSGGTEQLNQVAGDGGTGEAAAAAEGDEAPQDPALLEEWDAARNLKGATITSTPDKNLHVTAIVFNGEGVTDEDLAGLKNLPYLKELVFVVKAPGQYQGLEPDRLTSEGFAHLTGLSRLERLVAKGLTEIDDDACIHIGKLTALRHLDLDRTRVSDDGMAALRDLTNLEELHLAETRVTDDGLEHLKALTRLKLLDLSGTRIGGDGLSALASGAKDLRHLSLQGVSLVTEDLASIGRFTGLEELHLPGTILPEGANEAPVYYRHDEYRNQLADYTSERVEPETTLAKKPLITAEPIPHQRLNYWTGMKHLSGLVLLKSVAMTRLFRECPKVRDFDEPRHRDDQPLTDFHSGLTGERREVDGRLIPYIPPYERFRDELGIRRNSHGEWFGKNLQGERVALVEANPRYYLFLERPDGRLLEYLKDYKNVTTLDLSHFLLSDGDLKHLANHSKLERLDLSGQYISRRGLAHLKALPLRYLNLRGCNIGDEDLDAVRDIKTLRDVVLSQTRVTPKGAETFDSGKLAAVYDPEQKRPEWCDLDWPSFVDKLSP